MRKTKRFVEFIIVAFWIVMIGLLLKKHVFPDLLCAWQLRTIVFNALRFLPPALIGKLVQLGDTRALNVIHGLKAYPLNRKANGMHGDIQV